MARLRPFQGSASCNAPRHLEGGTADLGASLGVDILAADTLAVLGAGDFGLVALAVVLQTPGPLTVAALVMSSVSLRSIFTNLGLESIGISVKTLFDGPKEETKNGYCFLLKKCLQAHLCLSSSFCKLFRQLLQLQLKQNSPRKHK